MAIPLQSSDILIPMGARIGKAQRPIYGWKTVAAHCLGGLAFHRSIGFRPRFAWTVTHLASGQRIDLLCAKTKRQAQVNLRAALDLPVDWTMDDKAILKALRKNPTIQSSLREIAAAPL